PARRAMSAGALYACPTGPFATNPPEPNPARMLSPTTTMRRNRACAAYEGLAASTSATTSHAIFLFFTDEPPARDAVDGAPRDPGEQEAGRSRSRAIAPPQDTDERPVGAAL